MPKRADSVRWIFNGRCDEAIAFYKETVGATVTMLMRFRESPDPHGMPLPSDWDEKVMHAGLNVGTQLLMVSDGASDAPLEFKGFSMSLSFATVAEARRAFDALSRGGSVFMPFGKTFWSPGYGMLVDGFGVNWMISADA